MTDIPIWCKLNDQSIVWRLTIDTQGKFLYTHHKKAVHLSPWSKPCFDADGAGKEIRMVTYLAPAYRDKDRRELLFIVIP